MNAPSTLRFPTPTYAVAQLELPRQPVRWGVLAFWTMIVAAVAVTGAQFGPDSWSTALRTPGFNPPAALFAPVWSLLYAMMALAAWLVSRDVHARPEHRRIALTLFTVQLLLNLAWPMLYFGAHSPLLAFVDIVALWFVLGATVLAFAAVRPPAAWLLLPYLAWTSFALVLNGTIWLMNR